MYDFEECLKLDVCGKGMNIKKWYSSFVSSITKTTKNLSGATVSEMGREIPIYCLFS